MLAAGFDYSRSTNTWEKQREQHVLFPRLTCGLSDAWANFAPANNQHPYLPNTKYSHYSTITYWKEYSLAAGRA